MARQALGGLRTFGLAPDAPPQHSEEQILPCDVSIHPRLLPRKLDELAPLLGTFDLLVHNLTYLLI